MPFTPDGDSDVLGRSYTIYMAFNLNPLAHQRWLTQCWAVIEIERYSSDRVRMANAENPINGICRLDIPNISRFIGAGGDILSGEERTHDKQNY
jgi:hypothetical protein